MQSLLARHGKCTIKGGALAGTQYDAVAPDRVRKAAKRYAGDSDFQKFAKAFTLLEDLKEEDTPAPCRPVVVKPPSDVALVGTDRVRSRFWKIFNILNTWSVKHKHLTVGIVIVLLALLARFRFARVMAKLWVGALRLVLRRVIGFVVMLLEGVVDEMIYQLDFLIRNALPLHIPASDSTGGSSNWVSHILSGSFGAAIAVFTTWRRTAAGIPGPPA